MYPADVIRQMRTTNRRDRDALAEANRAFIRKGRPVGVQLEAVVVGLAFALAVIVLLAHLL